MTRPAFNYRAFVTGWRAICQSRNLDPRTGYPAQTEAVYRFDANGRRYLDRVPVLPDPAPECLCDEDNPTWWQLPLLWADQGAAHSSVEAEALASIAAQARRIAGVPEPETVADAVRAAWDEDGARRERQLSMPLRELHMARGEIVDLVAGVRMLVPIKVA